jgi:hypothetical protein
VTDFTGLAPGHYEFQAVYVPAAGDNVNLGASSACGTEPILLTTQASVTTTLSPQGPVAAGTSITDTAHLMGVVNTGQPGTVTISAYAGTGAGACTGTAAASGTAPPVTVSGDYAVTDFTGLAPGHYEFQAVYVPAAGDNVNLGASSTCGDEPMQVNSPVVSQITPTNTTCTQFSQGQASTQGPITYSTKGTTISQVAPGVIFYWVKIQVPSGGTFPATQTFTITQSTTYTPTTGTQYFAKASGSFAYDKNCNTLSTTIGGTDPSRTVTFTAAAPGTYFIGIKYSPDSIVGSGPAATHSVLPNNNYLYTFQTTGVAGSTSTVALNHK